MNMRQEFKKKGINQIKSNNDADYMGNDYIQWPTVALMRTHFMAVGIYM